jgi:UDP-glucose:(glucosyl)LPS alpha-1,2-glucosyltransferase
MKPKGGTELLLESLATRLNHEDIKGINLITSICSPDRIKDGFINIVWQHLSYDQPNVQHMLDRRFVDAIDYFVYVSHWQFNRFRERLQIPEYKSTVIKNAIEDYPVVVYPNIDNKIKLIYTSTPWRGLSVLVRAIQILNQLRNDFECDIYSSTKIYGSAFEKAEGAKFEQLFEACRQTDNINYHGYASNKEVRAAVSRSHILAYPSIFEETSCLSAIEALHAGCKVVTTNYGALPETCGDFATYVDFEPNHEMLSQKFAIALSQAIDKIKREDHDYVTQRKHYLKHWTWDTRILEWKTFLNNIKENHNVQEKESKTKRYSIKTN